MSELSQTTARGIVGRIGAGAPKDPGPLRAIGVARDSESPGPAVLVSFNRMPTDDELRALHAMLRAGVTALAAEDEDRAPIPMREGPVLNPRAAWPFPGQVRDADSEGGEPA